MLYCAGLMAGGNGTRLRASGIEVPKPMLQVGGRPLVSYFLDQAAEVGIQRIVAAVRTADAVVPSFLAQDTRFEWDFVETDGTGTLDAVRTLTETLGTDEHLISTCDVVLPPGSLSRFMKAVEDAQDRDPLLILLATKTIHDGMPIWLRTDVHDSSRVVELGKDIASTGLTFGHVRWVSAGMRSTMRRMPLKHITQDTKFLAMLLGLPDLTVLQHYEPDVVDVDDANDLAFVERFVSHNAE
jgi:NDP-sugar pyrophosphorylase family protein